MADTTVKVTDAEARVLARVLGRRGGLVSSPRKTAAARANAKKPRPRKPKDERNG
jgi:hypothetical protein